MANTSDVRYTVVVTFSDGSTRTFTDVTDYFTAYMEVTLRWVSGDSLTLYGVRSINATPSNLAR